MFEKLEKTLSPIADALTKNKELIAIRDGFLLAVPITIVGSIFLLIANFPINGWVDMIAQFAGANWTSYFDAVIQSTFDTVTLVGVLGIGYCYARELNVDKMAGAILSLICFLIVTPKVHTMGEFTFGALMLRNLGTAGMFLGMIIALVSVRIFAWAVHKNFVIKLPDGVPPAVMDSFKALIPSGIAMIIFFIVNIIFVNTPYECAHNFIYQVLQAPLEGLGRLSGFEVIYQFLSTLFWFFGINGPAVTNTIFGPIHKALTLQNYEAQVAGQAMSNIFVAGFSDFMCNFGGGGSTLGLVIMMAFLGKSSRIKQLGRLSLPAAIFGINEPIIFGLPIVLNPIMAIPFIFVPVINTVISTILTYIGIIPIIGGAQLPWTTPIFFSGYLVSGSWVTSFVQLGLLAIDMLVYYPFLKMLDKKYLADEANSSEESDELDDLSFDDLSLD